MVVMTPRESWTDGRLDEFAKRIDERFDEVDRRFDGLERRLEGISSRLDRLTVALIVGLLGVIATQL
jgi:hypothetical protein